MPVSGQETGHVGHDRGGDLTHLADALHFVGILRRPRLGEHRHWFELACKFHIWESILNPAQRAEIRSQFDLAIQTHATLHFKLIEYPCVA